MEKRGRKVKKDVFSPKCDKHPKYTLDLFCVDCNKLFCVICRATEHKNGDHTKIQTIEEASTDCAETKEFLEYEDKLNTVYTRGNETLAEINELNLMTDQFKKEAESLITKHKQDLIDLIEKHHKKLYESNKFKYEQSKKRLHGVNKQLCKNKNKTAGIRQEINARKESGQSVALFIAMKKSQDNLRQIEIELEEIEKSNFVERYKFQAGHIVGQLLEEWKEFGDLLVMATKSPKEPVEQYAGNGSKNYQMTPQEPSSRRDSTQSLNSLFTEETNQLKRFSGDIFKYPSTDAEEEQVDTRMPHNALASRDVDIFSNDLNKRSVAPPIARKPSPGTIRRRRNTWHQSADTVQLREIEQTKKTGSRIPSTEREQAAHPDHLFHVQSCQDMIQVPKQKPENYVAMWDYKPRTQDEIELKEGNVVTVLEKCSTDWFLAEVSGRRGYIPGYYVKKVEDKNPGGDLTNELEAVLLRRRATLEKSSSNDKVHPRDIVQTNIPVTAQPFTIDQKKLDMMWKRTDKNKYKIYTECERISKFIENISSSIVHVWPAYDTNANDDIVFVVLTNKDIEDDLKVKDKLEKTGYNVFVTHVDSCSKESEQVLQKVDQLETNQCFSKLADIGSVINKHSDRLLRNHQYLSAISGSNVRSERFSLGPSEHFVSFQSCIVLYVIAKGKIPLHENKFQDSLDGIPVDVREGIFQRTILPSERYSKPVKMGCQITSNRTPESFGTLGGFFYHKDFGLCGVTCAHVVLEEAMIHDLRGEKKVWSREESPMVFHPNTTQHEYKLGPVKEAVYRTGSEDSSGIDIAVFKIEGAAPDSGFFPEESEMCFETGRTLGTSDLKYNTPVLKYGRTTALTRGYIEFENTTVRMIKYERKYTLGNNEYTFLLKNQIEVRPESSLCTQLFNDFGDSGAFVFVKDSDNQLVCIGICVGKLDTHGIVIPISAVKRDLGISKFCDFRWHRLCEKIKEMDKKLDRILERLPSSSSQ